MRAAHLIAPRGKPTRSRAAAWVLAAALASAGAAALDALRAPVDAARAVPLDPAGLVPGYGPPSYAEALSAANSSLEDKRTLLAREPDDWVRMEAVARALLARARLTGSAADLAEANRLLVTAIASAPWPSGPTLSRAGAALSVHDLAGAEAALARFDASASPPPEIEQADAQSMRCEIAFERGDIARARRICGTGGNLSITLRRANIALASGDPGEAARIVETALNSHPRQSPRQLSRIMLQRTAIALGAGDWNAAGRWARAADRTFPGDWLAEAFVAQARALEGDTRGAEAAYRAIARRTGDPDVYGALVVLAEARQDAAAARAYRSAARRGWDARAALLRDTYAGHFAEHLVLSGESPRALAMAEGDYRRRPYLQPMTDFVFVLGLAGTPERIVGVVERGERAGFRSATLMLAKARALEAMGRQREAATARAGALAINPRVAHPAQAFVHFRQD